MLKIVLANELQFAKVRTRLRRERERNVSLLGCEVEVTAGIAGGEIGRVVGYARDGWYDVDLDGDIYSLRADRLRRIGKEQPRPHSRKVDAEFFVGREVEWDRGMGAVHGSYRGTVTDFRGDLCHIETGQQEVDMPYDC